MALIFFWRLLGVTRASFWFEGVCIGKMVSCHFRSFQAVVEAISNPFAVRLAAFDAGKIASDVSGKGSCLTGVFCPGNGGDNR